MTFTYGGDPATSASDATRFLLGDTDAADPYMQDSEVAYLLAQHGSPLVAAAYGFDALAAKYARRMDKELGPVKLAYSQRYDHFVAEAARLRALADQLPVTLGYLRGVGRDLTCQPPPTFTRHTGSYLWRRRRGDSLGNGRFDSSLNEW